MQQSNLEDAIPQFRQILPARCGTAQAIDRHEPLEAIATRAVEDGYIEAAEEFGSLVEAVVRRCG